MKDTITVKVPAGVDHGVNIRLAGSLPSPAPGGSWEEASILARFEALAILRSRLVSWHVAAADLEAAVVVGFAVQVVPALAAYERGVEGLVDRQAHSVFVWRALLRRCERHTVSALVRVPVGLHMSARGEVQRTGQQGRRRAWILRLTLQRSSSLASVHGLSA